MDPTNWNHGNDFDGTSSVSDTEVVSDNSDAIGEGSIVKPSCSETFDFSRSFTSDWPVLQNAPAAKYIRVKRREAANNVEKVIRISRDEVDSILQKLATRFGLQKERVALEYALKKLTEKMASSLLTYQMALKVWNPSIARCPKCHW